MPAIEVEGLRKRYGTLAAVDGVSFTVDDGEIFGLLGPNGAGKTTTLEILEGLRRADEGTISVLGLAPWPRSSALAVRIGVQLQATSFFEHLTAREQIRLFAGLYGAPPQAGDATLSVVGLDAKDSTVVQRLSGGQQQRLSIACALAHDPQLVFLDEPTGALDPQSRRNFWDVIRTIRDQGKTVMLTTHYMEEAEELCDRVAVIDHGQVLTLGSPAELVRALDAPTRVAVARDAITPQQAEALPGAFDVRVDDDSLELATREPAATIAELAQMGALAGLRVRTPTLEDVFLSLTGRAYRE
jgi:ABC-2 type transport system ATP-binding protein